MTRRRGNGGFMDYVSMEYRSDLFIGSISCKKDWVQKGYINYVDNDLIFIVPRETYRFR